MISIGFKPEYVFQIGDFKVGNSLITSFVVSIFLTAISIYFYNNQDKKNFLIRATKALVYELVKLIDAVTGDRNLSYQVLPLVATFFIFIFTANIFALFPGFLGSIFVSIGKTRLPLLRSPNSDLNTTLALALVSVLVTQFYSAKFLGLKGYLQRFINFKSVVLFITGFFEIISEGVKVISFSFRLFGNIFAGEVLLLVTAFLIPYLIPVPFMILEVFVGVIQAFIFAMLTLTFIRTSTIGHVSQKVIK